MKKLNLSGFFKQFMNVFFRFPAATFFSLLLFAIALITISMEMGSCKCFDFLSGYLPKIFMVLPLGFVLAIAIRLFFEDKNMIRWADWLTVPLMALYFLLLPEKNEIKISNFIQYTVFCIISALLVSIAPYITTKKPLAFWQYNLKLLGHLLFTALCSSILLSALSLAILAVGKLFGIYICDEWYFYLLAFFYTLFMPLLFAAGIPTKEKMNDSKSYPALRIIGEYVLVPVLALYLLIFYAYGIKILVTWQLPDGVLTWMVLAYSTVGLFTYFILHNHYTTRDSKISVWFGKSFFFSLLPLFILLFLAISLRMSDYGITEKRYFIFLFSFWLLGITIYMLLTKGRSFRPMIVSLAAVALLSVVGPWSVFEVSNCSQRTRLEKLFAKNNLLENGKFRSPTETQTISHSDRQQIGDIIYYFGKKHDTGYLQPLFTENIENLVEKHGYWNLANELLGNIVYKETYSIEEEAEESNTFYLWLESEQEASLNISGYDYFIYYTNYNHYEDNDHSKDQEKHYTIRSKGEKIEVRSYGKTYQMLNLPELVTKMMAENNLITHGSNGYTQQQLSIIEGNCKVIFKDVRGNNNNGILEITYAKIYVLIK